ncbi:conserved Plasmodium protein, unknown function [Plasmodium gallinaceum]|uniref:Uncharacterized protein n=1 Tax=Plasmodium gallinaceum TaxID=5849 RepID=A0A1J1GVD7_PLAGA|nr:conserved Plasmodium protein, unknown function [Plasmodium gallinaceum]CRG96487.1 conserved Plasmodium protein, unknown function [Plasmodium gallinaceum]
MIKNDECSILGEVINFENIYELMNVEEKNTLVILEEKINNFLLGYYKNFERLTIRELEELNNFLNIIIKKFIEEKRTLLVNILLIHFQNIPSSFINVKLKDNIFYIEEIKKFFLSILDLSSYLKKCKNDNSEKINSLITSIINFLNLFLVDTLKLIGSNVYKDFYIRIIIDSRILEIFNNLYFDQELENEKIIHSLLLLTEFKEFDDEICKCDIIKLFINLLSTNIYTNYLIIQIIINVVNRNIKIIKLLIHDEIELINNILEKIYISIKRECYDFTCINLLKLFSYIIEGNCFDKLIFFDEHYYLNNSGIIFFSTLYNIIEHIRSLIKFHNIMNILEEKNELFYDFICILFCVLRNLIELIINPHKKIIFRSINENSDENKKYKVNVEKEKKMLHLLCFDIINGVNSSSLTEIIDCTTLTEKIIKKIQNMKDKNMHNKYLYVKYLESLFYISLNNERVSKETLKENFIINIEENFYKINKDTKHKNLKNLELDNLLKLYYFGIINIFVKNNLTSEIILPFVNYVILEELKRKNFLLQNELYYLVFLQFLNIIIINNLYEFRKFIENDLLEDLLKIFKISSFHLKIMILKILIQWVEKKVILEEIKNYLNKNKMIFKVLLEFWKEIQNMNNGIRNLNLEINELNNIRSIIYYIFKILTNNFTKGLNYFSKNEEFLYYFRCIMIFEEKSILDIYNSIMNQTNTKELVVLENDKLILNGKIEKCKAKIENIEKKFHIIINLKDKKNINNLENFYNYVRGQHE